jgi:hypothetical protein
MAAGCCSTDGASLTIVVARSARETHSWMAFSSTMGLSHDTGDLLSKDSHGINFRQIPCFKGYHGHAFQSYVGWHLLS